MLSTYILFVLNQTRAICAISETCDQFETELLMFTLNKITLSV